MRSFQVQQQNIWAGSEEMYCLQSLLNDAVCQECATLMAAVLDVLYTIHHVLSKSLTSVFAALPADAAVFCRAFRRLRVVTQNIRNTQCYWPISAAEHSALSIIVDCRYCHLQSDAAAVPMCSVVSSHSHNTVRIRGSVSIWGIARSVTVCGMCV